MHYHFLSAISVPFESKPQLKYIIIELTCEAIFP